jgi:hypothetical protein
MGYINIWNRDRFPHISGLDRLGGEKSADGERYYEDHESELGREYEEIMNCITERYRIGGAEKIHGINNSSF